MPILAGRQRKQRTNAASVNPSQIFNAPGIYKPTFGKSKIYVSGHGAPGNAPTNGASYTNPATPGTYAGTNPSSPGTAVYNPSTPGNSGTNPSSGGNASGSNAPVMMPQNVYLTINYSRGDRTTYDSYRYLGPTDFAPYTDYQPHTTNYINPAGGYTYTVTTFSQSPVPGAVYYNPIIPGNPYTNPPTPGNIQYNPSTPGNTYSNPPSYVPGSSVPGNYVPGNYVPGNTNPATAIPGTYTPPRYVAGNTIPGNTNQPVTTPGNPVPGYSNPATYIPGNTVPGSVNSPSGYVFEQVFYNASADGDGQDPTYNVSRIPWRPGLAPYSVYTPPVNSNNDYVPATNLTVRYVPDQYYPGTSNPSYTNPGNSISGNYIAPYSNPGTYQAGYTNPTQSNPSAYYPGGTSPPTYAPGNTNPGYNNAYSNAPTTNPPTYTPGTNGRNPSVPGTIVYNSSTPGTAYYNSPTPGNTITSPPTPGTPGTLFVSLGVMFPGGPMSAPAPVVGDTLVEVAYTNAGIAVNVGSGGQVVVKETFV
jgi:hypothetical protein